MTPSFDAVPTPRDESLRRVSTSCEFSTLGTLAAGR